MKLTIAHIIVMGYATVTAITEIIVSSMQQTHILGLILGSLGLIGTPLIFFFLFKNAEEETPIAPNLSEDLVSVAA